MFRVLLCYDRQIADLEPVIRSEIFQGILVILGHFVGGQSRRHNGNADRDGEDEMKDEKTGQWVLNKDNTCEFSVVFLFSFAVFLSFFSSASLFLFFLFFTLFLFFFSFAD